MREYKRCEIDFEVGDIVSFKSDETYRPFKVLSITPRFITDDEKDHISKLMLMGYSNTKIGDEINPEVQFKVLDVGVEEPSWRQDLYDDKEGWDADYFTKIDLDYLNQMIERKIEDIADDNRKLNRLQKIKENVVQSLIEKTL